MASSAHVTRARASAHKPRQFADEGFFVLLVCPMLEMFRE